MRTLTLADALAVCSDLRPEDKACLVAVLGVCDPESFAVNRWQTEGPAWAMDQDGRPEAIFGLSFNSAWQATAWFVATPRFHSWKSLARFCRTVRGNLATGPHQKHRVEAHVLDGWDGAARLAEWLGFRLEGVRVSAGSGGESIRMYAMTTGYVGPNGQWVTPADVPAAAASGTPITITAGEQAAPTAAMLANIWATYQLNVAPYTRYRSDGTSIIAEG